MDEKTYQESINQWRQERDAGIRKENSWLALAGLYWLKLGKNQFGSNANNEVHLPSRFPENIGYFEYNGRSVSLRTTPGQTVTVNEKNIDFAVLEPDISENPSFIKLEGLQMIVIQRGNKMGVRIWDNNSEKRASFPTRTWYNIDEAFRLTAAFTPYDRPKMAYFPDLTGEKAEFPVEGFITFELNGETHRLDVNKEDDGTLFLRFLDLTSREETYPSGRYLETDIQPDGSLVIDFNKAYNPPCAFTDYATCVFAPEQNHLKLKITAGETYPRD
ncbi:MAG: DUF1684 domain-containing protein [Anaerolineales bacterium]|nr:DUF1684 domain-containing protein [Anaerolineales bacterium]MCB9145605.1 DUF1684 domain-containing protein [Anaerolineales bacterium]